MARFAYKLPDIGEGIAEAEIVAWHVKPGDIVAEDQPIADLMTDKATVAMETPVAGRVVELAGAVGDKVAIGAVLAVFETDEVPLGDGLVEPSAAMQDKLPVTEVEPASRAPQPFVPSEVEGRAEAPPAREGKILASPAVRRRARDLGIDLAQVRSAGDRVRHSDLDFYLLYHGGQVAGRGGAPRSDETVKLAGLRRRIAENMQEAKRRIPHFTLVEECDVTALEQARAMLNADRGDHPRLTLLPFLIRAVAVAVADHPQLNARYDDEAQEIRRSGAVHMGVATQTPGGLMVPVIRHAERLGLWDIAGEILRLAEAARSGKAAAAELTGSTITISSLGPLGGIVSTPVINRPEVAIIAVNKVEEKPVVVAGEIAVRQRMNLSLSCDHRVIDGWDAAAFLQAVKALIEAPLRLLSA